MQFVGVNKVTNMFIALPDRKFYTQPIGLFNSCSLVICYTNNGKFSHFAKIRGNLKNFVGLPALLTTAKQDGDITLEEKTLIFLQGH